MTKTFQFIMTILAFSLFITACKKDEIDPEPNVSAFDYIDLRDHIGSTKNVIFLNENEGWVIGKNLDGSLITGKSKLVYTDDGGSTWTTMNEEVPTVRNTIQFINSTDGYIIGNYTAYYTIDKGANWTEIVVPNPNQDDIDIYATASNSNTTLLLARVNGTSSALFFVSNATHEITNTVLINEMETPGHYMHLSETGVINIAHSKRTANDFREIAYSADNGATWSYTEIETDGEVVDETHYSDMCFPDDNTGYFTGWDNSPSLGNAFFYKTTNGGTSWTKKSIENSVSIYNFNQISFANATHGLAISSGDVYKTTDGGDTWTELNYFDDNYISTFSVSYPIVNHGFIGALNGADTDFSARIYKYTGQ